MPIPMAYGNDSYTVSLLHFDGTDTSTDIRDNAHAGLHTWTARGTAQKDTAQKKFGVSSLLLDGNSDWVDTPTSTDFSFTNGQSWTIDFWVKFASTTAQQGLMGAQVDVSNMMQIWFFGNAGVGYNYRWQFYWVNGSVIKASFKDSADRSDPGTSSWIHQAFVNNAGTPLHFIDGTSIAQTVTVAPIAMTNINSVYQVGAAKSAAGAQNYTNGWIDEFRVSKGIARWTSNFTAPAKAYDFKGPFVTGFKTVQ